MENEQYYDPDFVNIEAWEFYQNLFPDEKLMFMYDLLCRYSDEEFFEYSEDDYKDTEVKNVKTQQLQEPVPPILNFKEFISSTIRLENDVNIIFMNNLIIMNSNFEHFIWRAVKELFMNGFIFAEMQLNAEQEDTFKHLKYCKVYKHYGLINPVTNN